MKVRVAVIIISLFTLYFSLFTAAAASEKWQGVDEAVIEKVAREQGREAVRPLIDTDRGDLLLFVFLVAGAAGGFAAGYSWRMLTEKKTKDKDK